ncbi:MAG: hypothetical protein QE263_02385 [Vampirovibrionales bacterium]|nr:hypothetical protein [Vampirovibrionales bacterium]
MIRNRLITLWMAIIALGLALLSTPSSALVPLDGAGINQAVRHGIEHGRFGLAEVLGPNWMEKADGTLLNIYSPFMMLATKISKSLYPANESLKKVKKLHHGDIDRLTNLHYPVEVKFSLSSFGPTATFPSRRKARIEGIGRGKHFVIYPVRTLAPLKATAVGAVDDARGGTAANEYEAVIAYYFKIEPITNMDSFDLIVEDAPEKPLKSKPQSKSQAKANKSNKTAVLEAPLDISPLQELKSEPIVFHIQRDRIY